MLQAGHYILLVIILVILGWGFYKAGKKLNNKKTLYWYATAISIWMLYVIEVSSSGFLADFSLPPKVVVFVILPAFVFTAIFFSLKRFNATIAAFPIALTVYYQTFRVIVELLILGLYKEGIGPELVTFEGRNFDILAGLTAPIVGYLAYSKKVISHKAVIAWNIVGLLLLANIVFIFQSLLIKPEMWGFSEIPVSLDFTRPPYILIAAVFMPSAVFMHVFSIRKSLAAIESGNT